MSRRPLGDSIYTGSPAAVFLSSSHRHTITASPVGPSWEPGAVSLTHGKYSFVQKLPGTGVLSHPVGEEARLHGPSLRGQGKSSSTFF